MARATARTWFGPMGLAACTTGVLLGRASLAEVLAPFSLAYMAAAVARRRAFAFPVLVCLTAGRWWTRGTLAGMQEFFSMAFIWVAAELWRHARPRGDEGEAFPVFSASLAAAGAALLGRGVDLLGEGANPYTIMVLGCEVLLAAGCVPVFARAIELAGPRADSSEVTTDGLLCLTFLGCACALGTAGITLGTMRVPWILTSLVVMYGAGIWGTGIGAAVGAVAGGLLGVGTTASPYAIGTFTLAGLLAGSLRRTGVLGVAISYCSAAVLLAAFAGTTPTDAPAPLELAVAAGVYLAIPATLFMSNVPQRDRELVDAPTVPRSSSRLFPRLVQAFRKTGQARPNARSPVQRQAADRLESFAAVFNDLAQSFAEVSAVAEPATAPDYCVAAIIDNVGREICTDCRDYSRCWQNGFFATYRLLTEVLAALDLARNEERLPQLAQLKSQCRRADEMLQLMERQWELHQISLQWLERMAETREVVALQFKGLAQILRDMVSEARAEPSRNRAPARRLLEYQVGAAGYSRDGRVISGDSYLVRELPGDEIVALMSDGMGAGSRAALESQATVSLLERLLSLGLDRETALRTVNSVLLLRSTEETFATVDLAAVDLTSGRAEFVKIGAAPTFIRRGRRTAVVRANSLPMGILEQVESDSTDWIVMPGDMVVMITDGVLSGLGDAAAVQKENWLCRFLSASTLSDPEELASVLLAQVGSISDERRTDDMTVLALRFDRCERS